MNSRVGNTKPTVNVRPISSAGSGSFQFDIYRRPNLAGQYIKRQPTFNLKLTASSTVTVDRRLFVLLPVGSFCVVLSYFAINSNSDDVTE